MRVIDKSTRRSNWLPLLALGGLLLVLAARGSGLLSGEFLQRAREDPYRTLIELPRRSLEAQRHDVELPRLQVDMKFKHYEKILARREQALRDGILMAENGDFVPADITLDGRRISVRMRLKGDWSDHFDTPKWSYRVKTRGGETILGMRRFSLHHPKTRGYLAEWAFLERMRREGVLAPRYEFVRLTFNGEDLGIYALEEHFAKELLESQQRREGPIAKLEEGPLWSQRVLARQAGLPWLALNQLKFKSAAVGFFEDKTLLENPVLQDQANEARRLLHGFQDDTLSASNIFDVDTMARFLALCQIWGADHALIFHNMRFYYDPLAARLQPIAFDGEPRSWTELDMQAARILGRTMLVLGIEGFYSWLNEVFADETLRRAYLTELHRVSEADLVDSLITRLEPRLTDLLYTLRTEWPDVESPLPGLRRGASFVRGKLAPEADLRVRRLAVADSTRTLLQLCNVAQVPVELVQVDNAVSTWTWPKPLEIPGREKIAPIRWTDVTVPLGHTKDADWTLTYRTVGGTQVRTQALEAEVPQSEYPAGLPPAPTAAEAARRHAFLEARGGELWLREGVWDVNADLVLPENIAVRAGPDVTLRFAPEALLLARGPLHLEGTEQRPIRLLPQGESWPGVAVIKAAASTWRFVQVEATRGIVRPGWILTGGVTFYESPVQITGGRFLRHSGEDALNIVRSEFQLDRCEFRECASDAFDGDFVQGSVTACSFLDVGGDGVDVSGSTIELRQVVARRVADKAISIGEDSEALVYDLQVQSGAIAVAAKDLSHVTIYGGEAQQMKIGLTAYMKKSAYGPATIQAQDFRLESVEQPVLVEMGSVVNWNGQHYAGSEMDVRELYRLGVLGN